MKTSTPIALTNGTRRIAAPIMMPMASVPATRTVARTNWVSDLQATRPEESACEPAGAREEPHHPGPDEVAVGEEEVRREQHDEDAGDHVADGGADLADLADGVLAEGLRSAPGRCRAPR